MLQCLWCTEGVHQEPGLDAAAQLFKVLGNASRLRLVRLLAAQSRTVGALAAVTGMSQPLVSQHLRTLRLGGLVVAERRGKEMQYRIADDHVAHVVGDALAHVTEPARATEASGHQQGEGTP